MTSVTSSAEHSALEGKRAQSSTPLVRFPICTKRLRSLDRQETQPQTVLQLKRKATANGRAQVHIQHSHAGEPTRTETGTLAQEPGHSHAVQPFVRRPASVVNVWCIHVVP